MGVEEVLNANNIDSLLVEWEHKSHHELEHRAGKDYGVRLGRASSSSDFRGSYSGTYVAPLPYTTL
jgi:hypothetical protein